MKRSSNMGKASGKSKYHCRHGRVKNRHCADCDREAEAACREMSADVFGDVTAARDNNANSDLRRARTARFHLNREE